MTAARWGVLFDRSGWYVPWELQTVGQYPTWPFKGSVTPENCRPCFINACIRWCPAAEKVASDGRFEEGSRDVYETYWLDVSLAKN